MNKRKVKYICLSCDYVFIISYRTWQPKIDCVKCSGKAMMSDLISKEDEKPYFKRFKDVTGIGIDEQGREVAIDTKGKRIDPDDARYDLVNDPYGWEATGHKVKGKQKR